MIEKLKKRKEKEMIRKENNKNQKQFEKKDKFKKD